MADWHGYFVIEVTFALSNAEKLAIWNDLKAFGKQSGAAWEITQVRRSLDNQALLVEIVLAAQVTKAQVVNRLSTVTGYTTNQINNNTNFTRFTDVQEAREYLITNWASWENPD